MIEDEQDPPVKKPTPVEEDPFAGIDWSDVIDDPKPVPPKPRNVGAPVSSIWDSIASAPGKTVNAVRRGVVDAVNEGVTTITSAVGQGLDKLGVSSLEAKVRGLNPEQTAEFRKQFTAKYTDEQKNPFRMSDETVETIGGKKSEGIYGVVEGVTQFATGFFAAGGVLKVAGAATKGGLAFQAAKGALTDFSFFSAHADRLSDAVKGTWAENPISRMLESKDGDSDTEGRFKNMMEGAVLGTTIDAIGLFVKARRSAKAGKSAEARAVMETPIKPGEHDVVTVKPTEDGHFEVAPTASPERPVSDLPADGTASESLSSNVTSNRAVGGSNPKYLSAADAEAQASAINMVNKNDVAGHTAENLKGTVDPELFKTTRKLYEEGATADQIAERLMDGGVNPKYILSPDEVKSFRAALMDSHGFAGEMSRGRVISNAETADNMMARGFDGTYEEALRVVTQTNDKTATLAAEQYWGRTVQEMIARQGLKLSRAVDANPDDADLALKLLDNLETLSAMHAEVEGTTGNIGRALQQQSIPVDIDGGIVPGAKKAKPTPTPVVKPTDIFSGKTPQEIRDMARAVFSVKGDAGKMLNLLRGWRESDVAKMAIDGTGEQAEKTLADHARTWRMNAMLSNPITHVTNVVSNAGAMVMMPIERIYAGARHNNAELMNAGLDMLSPTGLWHDIQDSMKAMGNALVTGKNQLDASDPWKIGNLKDFSIPGEGNPFANALGAIVTAPSRFLMTSDEFFKGMNYRMNVRSQIMKTAREQGVTDGEEFARRLTDESKFHFAPDGKAINPWALEYSRMATYTNDLGKGTMGNWINEGAQKHPVIGLIMPFVKTPVNVFRYAWERTPLLNQFSAMSKADLASGDPARIAIAKGKAEVGALFWGMSAMLAYNGVITGSGPSDPELRTMYTEAGWRPYSVKVGDRYVSFRRGDPIFTSLSIAADIVEMSGGLEEQDLGHAVASFASSVAATVTNKSFMQGVSDFFDAVSSGQEFKMHQLLSNIAGSFIPTAARGLDPNAHIMETRGFVDEMKARVPGFSEQLETKRNIFGEPVMRPPGVSNRFNPFTVSGKVTLPGNVMNELIKIGGKLDMPPETSNGSMINWADRDLFDDIKNAEGKVQSPYDRMMELVSQSTLKADLAELIEKNPRYADAPSDEIRLDMATGIIKMHYEMAKNTVVFESEKLQTAIGQTKELAGARRGGGEEAAQKVIDGYSKLFVRTKPKKPKGLTE